MNGPLRRELPWREPWELARALAGRLGRRGLVLLEGDGSSLGRRAVLGVDPVEVRECRGRPGDPGARDPFAELAALQAGGGSWLGWLAYEAGAWVEPAPHWRPSEMATLWAARHDPLLLFDRQQRRCWLEGESPRRLEAMVRQLEALPSAGGPEGSEPRLDAGPGQGPGGFAGIPTGDWLWHTSPRRYADQVRLLRQWIAAGDLFQANLTACCEASLAHAPDPLALHGRLRRRCPAPFSALVMAGDEAVISASPERFLLLESDGRVETRPIKGTRPRHDEPARDAEAAAELVCDPKDRAENVMIVDLLRNDLGRVCRPGSISVPQLVGLESFAQVHHLTSVVSGSLAAERRLVDLLRACWPGGSITGAPKVRACRRLAELEPVARGPYCGSIFHLEAGGRFDSSILIRSVMVKGTRLRVHAGGGIVADSDPHRESEEMGWKMLPLLEALA